MKTIVFLSYTFTLICDLYLLYLGLTDNNQLFLFTSILGIILFIIELLVIKRRKT
ncbi:membrane-bound ClpP family serine protease [Streptococcus loxodontisalivarius]|uniref:Membrane-bound ClpP family serine protease n=1 Tax=Streptococcus loxodontisalivarius TaxID=1349415 RepID=A0ABS2PT16_9STRE|nr:membrane-bound ClpP family serine protease [Streptococcus loxodontisalivarius]